MTPEIKKVLDLALEALEKLTDTEQTYEALDLGDKAITAIRQARSQPAPTVQEPVAINEVQKLSDGFIENPEAIKYLLDCLRCVQGEEGLPQTHYNFIRAFQRKGYAVLQRLNEDYDPEWTFSKYARTPPEQPSPVQEPVAWMDKYGEIYKDVPEVLLTDTPLYIIPPAQPAPEEPVAVVSGYYGGQCVITPTDPARVFNTGTSFYTTAPTAQQEPKFWYDQEEGLLHDHFDDAPLGCIPLYTAPLNVATPPAAQRQWVGLTDEEIRHINRITMSLPIEEVLNSFARAIEAKLKEKDT